jgi:hypothetical protein
MAAGKYRLRDGEQVRTTRCVKASETVIEAGDLVALTSGLIVKAAAASAKIAFCQNGADAGTTEVEVSVGNDFTLLGTADANFAVANRGTEVDIVDTTQYIDLGTSSTDVLLVDISEDAGTVGSATNVTVRINKPLF